MKAPKGKGLVADPAGGIFIPKSMWECQTTDRTGQVGRATHMGLGAEEVEAIMVHSEDTRSWHRDVAAALDEEEGGAKQGEGTEEACNV